MDSGLGLRIFGLQVDSEGFKNGEGLGFRATCPTKCQPRDVQEVSSSSGWLKLY